ncbi:helix-turn-helix domain-containing protein [Actinospica robiniae]|uniref:helix-turn-helix domain-containing protein n=1 Tax=Actinospica robiniae TaxID=304901 RepID=UPI0004281FE1|nr:helix-turn-helix domain-containing protein [Actinospica robiniae]
MASGKQEDVEALPLGPQNLPEVERRRTISDPAAIKAIADPLRIRIMRLMQDGAHVEPRNFTVKQIATELGEPPTKLYRHIKLLLKTGFIQVAELRLVGGIVEQHYRTAAAEFALRPQPGDGLASGVIEAAAGAAIDEFLGRYQDALRAGRTYLRREDALEHPPHVASAGTISSVRIPQAKAAEFAERVAALASEFCAFDHEESGIEVNLLTIFYATE